MRKLLKEIKRCADQTIIHSEMQLSPLMKLLQSVELYRILEAALMRVSAIGLMTILEEFQN
jgi:hypothetical protein